MIIWLASYPRSGNTLTRQILNTVFDKPSYSRYDDLGDIAKDPSTVERVGHTLLPGDSWEQAAVVLQADPQVNFVKTHHPPEDQGKAIYVVRHPCAAVVSFVHYQRKVRDRVVTPEQILLGLPRGIIWGRHLDDWDPLTRPNTLLVRFEDLLADASGQIERIAEFTGLDRVGEWHNDFDALRESNPNFFRSGQTEPPWDELGAEGRRLLELLHGDWLTRLGYGEVQYHPDAAMLRRHLQATNQFYLDEELELRRKIQEAWESVRSTQLNRNDLHARLQAAQQRVNATHQREKELRDRLQTVRQRADATHQREKELREKLQEMRQRLAESKQATSSSMPAIAQGETVPHVPEIIGRDLRQIQQLTGMSQARSGSAGKRLIAYSLFGTDPVYHQGAIANAEVAPKVFPDWTVRFYVSEEIPADLIARLRELGAEVVYMTRRAMGDGLFWRFLPAADAGIDAVIMRDVDSLLSARDKSAVDAWLDSGKGVHVIRDHPAHQVLILAGLWGCRGGRIPRMVELLERWGDFADLACDQRFLARDIYPLIADDLLVHSDLVAFGEEQVQPIPMARDGDSYLGFPAERGELSEKRLESFRQGKDGGLNRLPMPELAAEGRKR